MGKKIELPKYHYWVGKYSGYVMKFQPAFSKNKPSDPTPMYGEKLSYMGYTTDTMWGKKMNTGRVLMKCNEKKLKKRRERERLKLRGG